MTAACLAATGALLGAGGVEFTLSIASSSIRPNIPALASAAGWNGLAFLTVNVTAAQINTLYIDPAWQFPNGLLLDLSAATWTGGTSGAASTVGGTALYTRTPMFIRNQGVLAGGGGGGGNGRTTYATGDGGRVWGFGGDGGAGQGFNGNSLAVIGPVGGNGGSDGSWAPTGGGFGGGSSSYSASGGSGGSGGGWGQAGNSGSGGSWSGSGGVASYPGSGGAAGACIDGNAYITWLAAGTRLGRIV